MSKDEGLLNKRFPCISVLQGKHPRQRMSILSKDTTCHVLVFIGGGRIVHIVWIDGEVPSNLSYAGGKCRRIYHTQVKNPFREGRSPWYQRTVTIFSVKFIK
jgi:hypothetical protein